MILDALFTGIAVVVLMKLWQKFIKRPVVWVIDDSESDTMIFKMNIKLDDCDVRYFNSVKGMHLKVALSPPDAVICDFFLQDNINGDQVLKFFKRNHIPAIITTGHDGDIKGVDSSLILHKSPDKAYFREIERWVHQVTT